MTSKKTTIKSLAVLAECSDGKLRQILIKSETEKSVLDLISILELKVQLLEDPIEGYVLNNQQKSKDEK